MTPDAKRLKFQKPATTTPESTQAPTLLIEYPGSDAIRAPSKSTLKALLEQALMKNCGSDTPYNDQTYLKPAGVLSLEQVLLPAIALQEETALKRIQAKIQRDAPEYKSAVEDGRRLVRTSIRQAVEAVQRSRQQRMEQQVIRRQEAVEQVRREKLQFHQERARRRQIEEVQRRQEAEKARGERFTAIKRQRNKSLYQEIVILHRSMNRLEKEQRMWKNAQEKQELWKQKVAALAAAPNGNTVSNVENESTTTPCRDDKDGQAEVLRERTETSIQDIVLASKRIQQGLTEVLTIMKEAEQTRQHLYKDYLRNHHFEGYQGVRNPKGLIRFLSQED